MSDFRFIQDTVNKNWVVLAPRRAKRPDEAKGTATVCPFCVGEGEKEIDSFGSVRVLPNKYPFAPIHEVIIHSPDHHKNFDKLPVEHVGQIIRMYQKRYLLHQNKGQVYIFHNRGEMGGESLPHPHSQLVVVPNEVQMQIPRLDTGLKVEQVEKVVKVESDSFFSTSSTSSTISTSHFVLVCPETSQWPDEVWIVPKKRGKTFGQITDEEISDLAKTLQRLVQIFDLRHNNDFPFNFYIAPGNDWYMRIIPRLKTLGGFELGTNIYVNTQDPKETIEFIKEHLNPPAGGLDTEKIKKEHQAKYKLRV